jgi:hypothetical protein
MVSMRRAMVSMRHAMVSMRRAGFAAWDAARKRRRIVDLRGVPPFTAGTPNKKGAPLVRDAFASTAGFVFQTAASSAGCVFFLTVLANRCLRAICCSGMRVRAVFRRASRYRMRAQGRGRILFTRTCAFAGVNLYLQQAWDTSGCAIKRNFTLTGV